SVTAVPRRHPDDRAPRAARVRSGAARVMRRAWFLRGRGRMSARLPRIAAAGLLLLAGCELQWPRLDGRGPPAPTPVPVGLVAEGPAFRATGAAEDVRRAIERVIARPVVLLTAPSRAAEEDLQHLVTRSTAERGAVAESRDRPCGAGGAVAAGIAAGVAGVY